MIDPPDHIPDLRRLKGMYAAYLLMCGVIVARLWYLQINMGPELAARSEMQRTRTISRVAPRGVILDAHGRVLATTRFQYDVSILPDELKKNPQVLPQLAQMLNRTPDDLAWQINHDKIKPSDPVVVARDVDIQLLTQIEEQKFDLPGVIVSKDPVRAYVDNQLCTHVLGVSRPIDRERLEKLKDQGYVGGDTIGVEGLEATYETALRGQDGGQRIAVDAAGRMQHNLEEVRPIPGHTLRLTLDLDLQKAAYDALKEMLDQGHPGTAVALDPNDGAVLAFVSLPSYDLNRFGPDYKKFHDDPLKPLINRASGSFYPCGSPFKLITAAAGLTSGTTTPTTHDYCGGHIQIGNHTFYCDVRRGHGTLDFTHAIGASCDVYFYRVAQRAGTDNLVAAARRFGLGAKTGIDLPVDARGVLPSPEWKRARHEGWFPGDLINMGIGQGAVGVTPLQLANYTAALANGGTLLRPQLVREIIDTSGATSVVTHRLRREPRGTLGLKRAHRDAIVYGMLRALKPGGTAARCAIPDLDVAGKTGTAENFAHGKKAPDHSVFVCFAPVDQPKIAIAVLVENGGFGAQTAAPIARRMLGQFFGRKLIPVPIGHRTGSD